MRRVAGANPATNWAFVTRVGSNVTTINSFFVNRTIHPFITGDEIRIAIRHRVRCFGFFNFGVERSEWGVQGGEQRYITVIVQS
jgi:hypothetical protein